jgi:hypothetical protein
MRSARRGRVRGAEECAARTLSPGPTRPGMAERPSGRTPHPIGPNSVTPPAEPCASGCPCLRNQTAADHSGPRPAGAFAQAANGVR